MRTPSLENILIISSINKLIKVYSAYIVNTQLQVQILFIVLFLALI